MLAKVCSAAVNGIEAYPVEVEVNAGFGDTLIVIVGLPDAAVKESRDRVLTALINPAFKFTLGRTTINLAPADVKKEGPSLPDSLQDAGFDLQPACSADKKIEDDLAEIEEDNELIQPLFLSSRVASFLKRQGIMKVSELASVSDVSLKKIAAEAGLDEAYVVNKKKEAQALEGENLSKANISADLLKKLPRDIRYARDLINIETIVPSLTDNERALMHEALEKARTVTAKVK